MNEGWQNDDYFIVFTEDESLAAMKAYRFDHHLPGYTLLGLRGWDDFIVINSSGVIFTIPTLPLDASYAAPFALPQQISLEPDERFAGKIKWYTKPLVCKRPVKSSTRSSYKHDDGHLLTIGVH